MRRELDVFIEALIKRLSEYSCDPRVTNAVRAAQRDLAEHEEEQIAADNAAFDSCHDMYGDS